MQMMAPWLLSRAAILIEKGGKAAVLNRFRYWLRKCRHVGPSWSGRYRPERHYMPGGCAPVDSGGRRNTKAEGGCDGGSATFGSGFAGEVSFAWPAWRSPA